MQTKMLSYFKWLPGVFNQIGYQEYLIKYQNINSFLL